MLESLFQSGRAPHGICLLWDPGLLWLHAGSDIATGISYFAIPIGLTYLIARRRDLIFGWMFWLFALFILACGTTHFMDVWVLWHPDYAVQGLLKAFTAGASILTAALLWWILPRLETIPTSSQYRQVTERLSEETVLHERTIEELRRTEERFQMLVHSVRDYAMFMLDRDGNVTSWNTGAQRIKGYTGEEIIGRHFSCFYPPEDRAAGSPAVALETAAREGQFKEEGWRLRQDGSRFMAEVVINPILDADSLPIGFAKVTRDITERKQAEAVLEQTRANLAQSQKMEAVGQLTGGIAHDFNNMLTAILGSVELMEIRKEVFSKTANRGLQVIRHAANHGADLTRRLLAFSRKQTLAPAAADINTLVSAMSELIRRSLGESILVETVLAGDLWPVFADTNQIESALLNLAVNGRDAMPEGGRLTIETGNIYLDSGYARRHAEVVPGDYVYIAVSDTGSGMSKDVLQRAFEPFYTTKGAGKGTGLGLSQVWGFVRQSGGYAELYSELGQGTTVKLYLPKHLPTSDAVPAETIAASNALPGGSEAILVVEDDDDVRSYSADALRHLGYDVLEAAGGPAALAMLQARPDVRLMFTDVGLPGMNGRQLAEKAVERLPGLKIVYTSGYARSAVAAMELVEKDVALLPKPFRIEALAQTLRSVLDRG